ncbi:glutaminyl cyclase [Cryptococcus wingfieldii CBS 7118]|uniref:Peptide hydrolase n=1 Tax=Cryptococcus wingfieldii CBS 7118 TaxID=1295528 RepID=A0A1E3K2E3_9TREE|nr:glutaminyl cyclase [Cryptococcus wingfieldii CBS 7118]ODO06382.1 glutaminyl cyclase [Cryptococcus wingfieldii CBS 7118]
MILLHPPPRLLSILLPLLLSLAVFADTPSRNPFGARSLDTLSASQVQRITESDPPEWESVSEGHLGKLLIPRASGSTNNTLVQEYISSVLTKLGWHEEKTPFTWETPIGDVDFTNLVYTFNPDAPRKVVLAAHFDSKWFPDYPANQFIGAIDSAAPCAMLLSLAEFLTPLLSARSSRISSLQPLSRPSDPSFDEEEAAETTVQIIFFDGEEAFHDWTDTDSIYGARFLAQDWAETFLPPEHPLSRRRLNPAPTTLQTIDHLILLDLLGHPETTMRSYYRETDWLFDGMAAVDKRLREAGLVEVEVAEKFKGRKGEWFIRQRGWPGAIGDDHVPFVDRGVSVLHLISAPFPPVWHTLADDVSALSLPALRRWNKLLRVFMCEYLQLSPDDLNSNEGEGTDRARDDLVGS